MSQDLMLVNTEVAKLIEAMEPRHVALLGQAIMNPDTPLIELSGELWPRLGYDRRRQIIKQSNVSKVIGMVSTRPFAMAALMATKLAPVLAVTLFELSQTAGKENVRATAAKELLRLAQTTYSKLIPSEDEPVPTEELDDLLDDVTTTDSGSPTSGVDEARGVLTEAELLD